MNAEDQTGHWDKSLWAVRQPGLGLHEQRCREVICEIFRR